MKINRMKKVDRADHLDHTDRKNRSGFTLFELLLVISIIAVLASMAVGVIVGAQHDARVAATLSRMQIIERLLITELEDYEVRRSPVSFANIGILVNAAISNGPWEATDGNGRDRRRLYGRLMKRMIVADLIRAELPNSSRAEFGIGEFPSQLFRDFLQDELNIPTGTINARITSAITPKISRWEGDILETSELLYRILRDLDVDGISGLDALGNPSAIGDTDGDGNLEIVDAWGERISFRFLQQVVIPDDGSGITNPSGIWVEPTDPTMQTTDFRIVLPVLPSDLRVNVTSLNVDETDGAFATFQDFVSSGDLF